MLYYIRFRDAFISVALHIDQYACVRQAAPAFYLELKHMGPRSRYSPVCREQAAFRDASLSIRKKSFFGPTVHHCSMHMLSRVPV